LKFSYHLSSTLLHDRKTRHINYTTTKLSGDNASTNL